MEASSVHLVVTFIFVMKMASSESNSADYYNGTTPYHLTSSETQDIFENGNTSFPDSSPDPFTPRGLVDDSEEENFQNQATTTAVPVTTNPPESIPSQTGRPIPSTTTRPKTSTPTISANSTLPPGPGFSTQSSDDNFGNKGNGQGGGSYGGAPSNPSPAGPVPGTPIQDGIPSPGAPGSTADGMNMADGPSTCLCLALCLTQTPGPQAPPGNGPCVSICACVGASTQSGTPASGGSKDVPAAPVPPSPPIADLPAASVGTDTAQSAVHDGTAVAASQAPPPPTPPPN